MRIRKIYETYKFNESDLQGFIDLNCEIIKGCCAVKNDVINKYYFTNPNLYQAAVMFEDKKYMIDRNMIIKDYYQDYTEGTKLCKGFCVKVPNSILEDNYSDIFKEIENLKYKTNIKVKTDISLNVFIQSEEEIYIDHSVENVIEAVVDYLGNGTDDGIENFDGRNNVITFDYYGVYVKRKYDELLEYIRSNGIYVTSDILKKSNNHTIITLKIVGLKKLYK